MSADDDTQRGGRMLACWRCACEADAKTLGGCGGLCFPCFARYCRAPRVWPAIPRGLTGPRAWLQRLLWRQQQGERLSGAALGAIAEMQHAPVGAEEFNDAA